MKDAVKERGLYCGNMKDNMENCQGVTKGQDRLNTMTIKIPLEKLRGGIQYSLKKSEEHLVRAGVLIERNLLSGAVALIEFAIEEFGRAQAFREKLRKGSARVRD